MIKFTETFGGIIIGIGNGIGIPSHGLSVDRAIINSGLLTVTNM